MRKKEGVGTDSFVLFERLFLMLLDVKLFVTGQVKALKVTFFLIHFLFLKICDEKENCHAGEGVRKVTKKCHILLNGLSRTIFHLLIQI